MSTTNVNYLSLKAWEWFYVASSVEFHYTRLLSTTVRNKLLTVPGYLLHFFPLQIHQPVVLFLIYRKSTCVHFLFILHCAIHMDVCVDWRLTERDGWVCLWESVLCQNMCTCLSMLECNMLTLTCHFFGFFIPLSMKTTVITLLQHRNHWTAPLRWHSRFK